MSEKRSISSFAGGRQPARTEGDGLDYLRDAWAEWHAAGRPPGAVTAEVVLGLFLASYQRWHGMAFAADWDDAVALSLLPERLRRADPEVVLHVAEFAMHQDSGYWRDIRPEILFVQDWNTALLAANKGKRAEAIRQDKLAVTPAFPKERKGGVWNT